LPTIGSGVLDLTTGEKDSFARRLCSLGFQIDSLVTYGGGSVEGVAISGIGDLPTQIPPYRVHHVDPAPDSKQDGGE
jgi:hypothetical protein